MIHDRIEFWNTAELTPEPYQSGLRLQRFPASVRTALAANPHGMVTGTKASSIEIRFRTDSPRARLYVKNLQGAFPARIYRGNWLVREEPLKVGTTTCIELSAPEKQVSEQFLELSERHPDSFYISPMLWRVVFDHQDILFEGLDAGGNDVFPPSREELPPRRWLAYGSSITHASPEGYVHVAAERLGWDVMNKGVAGGCLCEPEMADYLSNEDWDIATLELGINMRGAFPPEEFEARAGHLIRTLHERNPGKPIGVINLYDNYATGTDSEAGRREAAYREILDRLVAEIGDPAVVRISAREVMDDFRCLSADFVHPTCTGHARMGANLAPILAEMTGKGSFTATPSPTETKAKTRMMP